MTDEAEVREKESEEHPTVKYADKLIHLDNGALLIGRVIINHDRPEQFVYVYRPVEIQLDDMGSAHMHPWIPESSDDFYFIPTSKVLNVSNPRPEFQQAYHSGYLVRQEQQPVENENDSELQMAPDGSYLH